MVVRFTGVEIMTAPQGPLSMSQPPTGGSAPSRFGRRPALSSSGPEEGPSVRKLCHWFSLCPGSAGTTALLRPGLRLGPCGCWAPHHCYRERTHKGTGPNTRYRGKGLCYTLLILSHAYKLTNVFSNPSRACAGPIPNQSIF